MCGFIEIGFEITGRVGSGGGGEGARLKIREPLCVLVDVSERGGKRTLFLEAGEWGRLFGVGLGFGLGLLLALDLLLGFEEVFGPAGLGGWGRGRVGGGLVFLLGKKGCWVLRLEEGREGEHLLLLCDRSLALLFSPLSL